MVCFGALPCMHNLCALRMLLVTFFSIVLLPKQFLPVRVLSQRPIYLYESLHVTLNVSLHVSLHMPLHVCAECAGRVDRTSCLRVSFCVSFCLYLCVSLFKRFFACFFLCLFMLLVTYRFTFLFICPVSLREVAVLLCQRKS